MRYKVNAYFAGLMDSLETDSFYNAEKDLTVNSMIRKRETVVSYMKAR